jgi:peptidoglycan/xylan/chitin deacetylase (PgdA/CDA1 family)
MAPRNYRPAPLLAASLGLHGACALAAPLAGDRWPLLAGTLMANHLLLAAASLAPRSHWLGANVTRLPAAARLRGEVALTFDDGPDPEVTPRVLELLEAAGARATFFPIGRRALAYPELVAEIVRRGHRVENHTLSHPHLFAFYTPGPLRREVEGAQQALGQLAGEAPRLFRAPAGMRNPFLDWVLYRAGLRLVSWTRRGFDTVDGRAAAVSRRLLADLDAGDILLLHDGSAAPTAGGRAVTLEVLPALLDELGRRGLRSLPLGEESAR